jgi:hypothetical protein
MINKCNYCNFYHEKYSEDLNSAYLNCKMFRTSR